MVTYRKMDLEKADEIVILGEVVREVTFEQRPDGQGGQRGGLGPAPSRRREPISTTALRHQQTALNEH